MTANQKTIYALILQQNAKEFFSVFVKNNTGLKINKTDFVSILLHNVLTFVLGLVANSTE